MVPICDSGFSNLFCAEEYTIFDNDEYGTATEEVDKATHYQNQSSYGKNLPLPSDEFLRLLIEQECHHLPRTDYLKRLRNFDLDLMTRKEAVNWIIKKGKAWTMQLLAVACLSLAAKMEETQVPLSLDLQMGESKFVFESRTIQRMEILVLSTLKWRMQAVTPFSFIDYYLHMILDDKVLLKSSIVRSIQLFSSTIQGIEFLEFKPSELAAAVAVSVAGETQTVDTDKAISLLTHNTQKEERVIKCIKLIGRVSLICSGSVLDPQSPDGVLEIGCLSYKSDETGGEHGLCESSSHGSPAAIVKRRRLNRACDVVL